MKSSNTIVSVIVIAAVLLAAYAVGLLIRQARLGGPRTVAEVNEAAAPQPPEAALHRPGHGQPTDTPELRAKTKEQRAQTLEEMNSWTEEQKEQFRQQVRDRFSGRRTGKRGLQNLSPEERERMAQRRQNMSAAEREAMEAQLEGRVPAGPPPQGAGPETPPDEETPPGQTEEGQTGSEPNEAGQG